MALCRIEDWKVTESPYQPELNTYFETVFVLANGYMGVRGTPEEGFSGPNADPGTYLAHVYETYPATHEWRRTGMTGKCDLIVRCLDWIGIRVQIGAAPFDPRTGKVTEYERSLDMARGTLTRRMVWESASKQRTRIEVTRFVSQAEPHLGAIRFSLEPLDYDARVAVTCDLAGYTGADSVWTTLRRDAVEADGGLLVQRTGVTKIEVAAAMRIAVAADGKALPVRGRLTREADRVARSLTFRARAGRRYDIDKFVGVCTSRDLAKGSPERRALAVAVKARRAGFERVLSRHTAVWDAAWRDKDVRIEGDAAAQQGIRFSMFQMEQAYSGRDPRLNIAARGLTGRTHGGQYFWDTEIYMLPYYVFNDPVKARSLLMHRHYTLPQARERAALHGLRGAMYPWSTIDGQESCKPWEYSLLQIHVSGAVPYGVWLYQQATHDTGFLLDYGAELLIEGCRFWASRSYLNPRTRECVINCVTGPDEYTVAVNNDVYTNALARFVLAYGVKVVAELKSHYAPAWRNLARKLDFAESETADWALRARRMRIPFDQELGIHPQHDTFLDMDPIDLATFPEKWRPAWRDCPWDYLIRTQVVKQPDVLLAMFLFSDWFDRETKRANYEFYDPKTIHESSLGACIHSIIASEIGLGRAAFDYYMRGARLDLDDRWTDGIRTANAGGSWVCLAYGFAGMRMHTRTGDLSFAPHLPRKWKSLSFTLHFRGRLLRVTLTRDTMSLELIGEPLTVRVQGRPVMLRPSRTCCLKVTETP